MVRIALRSVMWNSQAFLETSLGQLLNFHAAIARKSRPADLLGIRDASMADNLAFIVARERGRGKVLAFAHKTSFLFNFRNFKTDFVSLTVSCAFEHASGRGSTGYFASRFEDMKTGRQQAQSFESVGRI